MIKMNFWLIALLINVFVAVLVLIFTYDLAFTTVRVIKYFVPKAEDTIIKVIAKQMPKVYSLI